uniref:N-acetylgalactosaminide beta-1,3-galactosyltransferase n=1 Tax=Panagrellus redivivus TaxID=6233 RepID=A0A7E5A2E0_PANRE
MPEARAAYDIWGRHCDKTIFLTNSPMDLEVEHIYFPLYHTRGHSMLYATTFGQYEWYLRADDDAFVVMKNARTYLSRFNSSQNSVHALRWGFFETAGYPDGSTYILSWRALETFVKLTRIPGMCTKFHRAEEDQELGSCLATAGVTTQDTRDEAGRQRFHQFHPDEIHKNDQAKFNKRHYFYPYFNYPDVISPTTISIHHLSVYETYFADFLVNKIKISDW